MQSRVVFVRPIGEKSVGRYGSGSSLDYLKFKIKIGANRKFASNKRNSKILEIEDKRLKGLRGARERESRLCIVIFLSAFSSRKRAQAI